MPGHRKKIHSGQFPRPTQHVEGDGEDLHAAAAAAINHGTALLSLQSALQQNVISPDHDDAAAGPATPLVAAVIAQTVAQLMPFPNTSGLSTEEKKNSIRSYLASACLLACLLALFYFYFQYS